jgi:hypothetical protein
MGEGEKRMKKIIIDSTLDFKRGMITLSNLERIIKDNGYKLEDKENGVYITEE